MYVNFQLEGEDEDTWKRFKAFVLRNEGKLRGELGHYVSRALNEYMNSSNQLKRKKILGKKRNVSFKRAYSVWNELISDGTDFDVGDSVPGPTVERFIKEICGTSHVTINKYKNLMTGFRLLYEKGTSRGGTTVYEIGDKPEWAEEIE